MAKVIANLKNSQFFFLTILIVSGYFVYQILSPYLSSIILAVVTVFIFQKVYLKILNRVGDRKKLASFLTTMIVLLVIVVPILITTGLFVRQAQLLVNDIEKVVSEFEVSDLDDSLTFIEEFVNDNVLASGQEFRVEDFQEDINQQLKAFGSRVGNLVLNSSFSIAKNSINIVVNFVIYFLFLFTLFPYVNKFSEAFEKVSPLDDKFDKIFVRRVMDMSKAMLLGTFLISAIQALITVISFRFAGVPYIPFWFVTLTVIGILPVVGTTIIVFPVAGYLLLIGEPTAALIVIMTNLALTIQVDNLVRPMLVPKSAELHPVLTLISVLGGLSVFGTLGFMYGPVTMIIFVTALQIYINYYQNIENKYQPDINEALNIKDDVKSEIKKTKSKKKPKKKSKTKKSKKKNEDK